MKARRKSLEDRAREAVRDPHCPERRAVAALAKWRSVAAAAPNAQVADAVLVGLVAQQIRLAVAADRRKRGER